MKVLALDCSTDLLSVALRCDSGFAEVTLDLGLRHAESLTGLIELCLARASLEPKDLDLIACALGPGSFTGLRIGMATAKGMALALGKPWIAVPTLDALAWGKEHFSGAVVPIVDGKKGRFYSAIYVHGFRVSAWLDLSLARLLELMDTYPDVLFTGPDSSFFEEASGTRGGMRIDRAGRNGAALAMCELAKEIFARDGKTADDSGPLYLRPSEAEESDAARKTNESPN